MLNPTEGVLVPGRQASLARVYMKNRCGQAREIFYNVEDSSTHVTGVTVYVYAFDASVEVWDVHGGGIPTVTV